ncbi:MAG: oxidoreductase [Lutibacter sp.]|nr:oxidoreductase [Lutibacter sp.]
MKRTVLYFAVLSILFSCKEEFNPRETVKISIEKFKMDSTSIRAIEIINDSTIIYAGSVGDIGIITASGKLKATQKIVTDTIIPHFRALAYTKEAFYVLSVENPALLYKFQNNTIEIVYKEEHEKVFYDCMKFFDEHNGIAIGDPTDDCLSILITRDGGNSWGKMDCENLPKIEDGEAAFAASNTNIAIVGENAWIATGGLKARVFHTSDMGLTWNVYNTPIIQGKNTTGIYSVDFYNEEQGIICGGDYTDKYGNYTNKAITNNGGKTWEVVAENEAPKYVSCVQYVPNTNGKEVFAVSTNGIFYSKNSGRNWNKVSDESFYTIRFASKNVAWLSGNEVIAKMNIN